MHLQHAYEKAIASQNYKDDPMQRRIIMALEQIEQTVLESKWYWFQRSSQVDGLYMYGPVGVGKTFLMDLFYQNSKVKKIKRYHFHHFMQHIHGELRARQGQTNPLDRIAKDFAKHCQILCLDEFIVYDIADAMILANLLETLLKEGVTLIATSNTKPSELYLKGLQRQRFLPAIDLLQRYCTVIEMQSQKDYRLNRDVVDKAYLYPHNQQNEAILTEQFARLESEVVEGGTILIQKRSIPFVKQGHRSIWFDFEVLCNIPRSQLDYLELSKRFDTIFLSAVPAFRPQDTSRARLFMLLIDVLYDEHARVILTAEKKINELYISGPLYHEFQRTKSRLHEMQSASYMM